MWLTREPQRATYEEFIKTPGCFPFVQIRHYNQLYMIYDICRMIQYIILIYIC